MRYSMYSPFLVALRLWSWPICRSLSHTLSSWSHMKSQTQNDLWTWFKRFQNAILFRMFHLFCASNTCHPGQSPLEWLPCGKTEYWGCPGTVAPKKAEENCDMHKTIGVRPESTAHLGAKFDLTTSSNPFRDDDLPPSSNWKFSKHCEELASWATAVTQAILSKVLPGLSPCWPVMKETEGGKLSKLRTLVSAQNKM